MAAHSRLPTHPQAAQFLLSSFHYHSCVSHRRGRGGRREEKFQIVNFEFQICSFKFFRVPLRPLRLILLQVNSFDAERYDARWKIAQDWNLQQDAQEEGQAK